ncbi:acetyl-CoA carboxylase biotin carboxyl carrier protein [Enterococcus mediterraneensis]|uniref:acetyl-CoA carboxylase biotin carboxyl carrier protein n=1 Tax=Enterococcus mediterraneensis TaxID=2364791 RepID=UPI000F049A20|nr:acetyl-CoA carboxylase biotin carboxyl carrier protein [Enterococcus mediterraneensis]
MEIQEIKNLLNRFDESSLTEFKLRENSFELYFNKNTMSHDSDADRVVSLEPAASGAVQMAPISPVSSAVETAPTPASETAEDTTKVVSPLVGLVYLAPSADKPVFKKVGDHVKKGDVLCIVEAMKVMNEITSDVSGEIVEVLVENEQAVEYNQPLFAVKEG